MNKRLGREFVLGQKRRPETEPAQVATDDFIVGQHRRKQSSLNRARSSRPGYLRNREVHLHWAFVYGRKQ